MVKVVCFKLLEKSSDRRKLYSVSTRHVHSVYSRRRLFPPGSFSPQAPGSASTPHSAIPAASSLHQSLGTQDFYKISNGTVLRVKSRYFDVVT